MEGPLDISAMDNLLKGHYEALREFEQGVVLKFEELVNWKRQQRSTDAETGQDEFTQSIRHSMRMDGVDSYKNGDCMHEEFNYANKRSALHFGEAEQMLVY
jgi:hypothetical protein